MVCVGGEREGRVDKGRKVVGGVGQGATLHHKKVLPILGILSTDATYYLSRLLSFKFIFGLRHMKGKATQVPQ